MSETYVPPRLWRDELIRAISEHRLALFAPQVRIASARREHAYVLDQLRAMTLFESIAALPIVDALVFRSARRSRNAMIHYFRGGEQSQQEELALMEYHFLSDAADAFVLLASATLEEPDEAEIRVLEQATAHSFVVTGDVVGLLHSKSEIGERGTLTVTTTLFRILDYADSSSSRLRVDTAEVQYVKRNVVGRARAPRYSTFDHHEASDSSPADMLYQLLSDMYVAYFGPTEAQLTVRSLVDGVEANLVAALERHIKVGAVVATLYETASTREIDSAFNFFVERVWYTINSALARATRDADFDQLSAADLTSGNARIREIARQVRLEVLTMTTQHARGMPQFARAPAFLWAQSFYDLVWEPVTAMVIVAYAVTERNRREAADRENRAHASVYDVNYREEQEEDVPDNDDSSIEIVLTPLTPPVPRASYSSDTSPVVAPSPKVPGGTADEGSDSDTIEIAPPRVGGGGNSTQSLFFDDSQGNEEPVNKVRRTRAKLRLAQKRAMALQKQGN